MHLRRVGGGQVDLVDDRQHLQSRVNGQIRVSKGLRLNALRRVHDQQRAFARGQRARDLIVEVHVARGVDEVHVIGFAVVGLILHTHGARLDCDAALALEIHVVEQLLFHLALGHGLALFEQAVGQRGFAVVDVGNN